MIFLQKSTKFEQMLFKRRVTMWKWLNLYKIGIPLILLSTTACSSDRRYHCRFDSNNMSSFDKMVEVYKRDIESDQRVVWTYYFDDERGKHIKTSDKDNVVVTTYWDQPHKTYRLFKIDMSSSPVTFNYGFAYHNSIKEFESMYQMPYTEENFNSINLHPEIVKYIPPKENEQHISYGFWRKEYDCGRPLFFIEYLIKIMLNGLLAGLSA